MTRPGVAVEQVIYRVTWSVEDQEYVATCAVFPSLSHLARDRTGALAGLRKLVADVIKDMADNSKTAQNRKRRQATPRLFLHARWNPPVARAPRSR